MIHRSPWPEVEVPERDLGGYVLGDAAATSQKPAIVDAATGETTTYAELDAAAGRVAAGLRRHGVEPGDMVGLIGHNGASWAIAYYGILRAGAVVTPLNPVLTDDEVQRQVADSHAGLLLSPERALELSAGAPLDPTETPPEELAILPYSSGTTGTMKGVMLSHRNLVANLKQIEVPMPIGSDDVLIGLLPFFHIYGQTVVLNLGLANGATTVTMPRFDLDRLLEAIERHRATWLHIAPPVVLALATAPEVERRDLSSLKMVISGAAPLDEDLARRAEERIGAPIRQGYGMTELSPVSHKSPLARAAEIPPGSVGPLVPNTEARLVDPESGQDLAAGEQGELWIRGPQMMSGYLHDPEATAEAITPDGWLRTGDIARIDEAGNAFIVDRLKELIKYKGYQVPPAELEAVLVSHPKVRDAGVVGVPSEEGGEAPKAFVVASEAVDPEDLIAYVAQRVAPFKRVREVELTDEIPKSASGKILRRVLRERQLS